MAELHTPAQVAELLGIVPGTLRKWSHEFATLLSPSAAASGRTVRRRYTDSDIALLRHAQALLQHGATYEEARQRLLSSGNASATIDSVEVKQNISITDARYHAPAGEVTVLDERPEVEALRLLLDAQRSTIEAQRATLESQSQLIAQLQQQIQETKDNTNSFYAQSQEVLAHQEEFIKYQETALAEVRGQLAQAKHNEEGALASLQTVLEKIPRWLRGWLGLGA